jgi:hypothetical protein
MNKFSLKNVQDREINGALMQVQDALNLLASKTAAVEPLKKQQQTTAAHVATISAKVSAQVASETPSNIAFTFTQGIASSSWAIQHNLGFYPAVTVVDSAGSTVIGDVSYESANALTINFTASFSGVAYLS